MNAIDKAIAAIKAIPPAPRRTAMHAAEIVDGQRYSRCGRLKGYEFRSSSDPAVITCRHCRSALGLPPMAPS